MGKWCRFPLRKTSTRTISSTSRLFRRGSTTSQFEQQLRAVCGLPPGSPELMKPAVMWNLLGDLWKNGEPDWTAVLADPRAKLHLYGKSEARPGRKMGHVCVLADSTAEALASIERMRAELGG